MKIEQLKNQETVIFACSGPSLNNIDVFSLGLPVIAISTTIRKIQNPHVWVYSDYLNEMHGDEGKKAYLDENILKIIQDGKAMNHLSGKNIESYKCASSNRNFDPQRDLFDFSKPFARGPHKSVTFGIQWAHSIGIKNIIFAGNDLKANSMETKYCYPLQSFDTKKKHNFSKTLKEVNDALKEWYPIAKNKGYNWYSWNCGDVFDNMVEKLTDDKLQLFKKTIKPQEPNPISEIKVDDIILEDPQIAKEDIFVSEKQRNKQKIDTYIQMMRMIKRI